MLTGLERTLEFLQLAFHELLELRIYVQYTNKLIMTYDSEQSKVTHCADINIV